MGRARTSPAFALRTVDRSAAQVARASARGLPLLVMLALPAIGHAAPTEPGTLQNALQDSSPCFECHVFPNPSDRASEPNFSPGAYRGSLMANSARDPVFWAGLALAHQDLPEDTITCVRCHVPQAFLAGRGDIVDEADATLLERDGIGCDLCHRMTDDGVTPAGNAAYVLDDVAVDGRVASRGPWSYGPGEEPPHPTVGPDAHVGSSRMCGTCHDVTTPAARLDAAGQPTGTPFNEQRTYSEWVNSGFADGGADDRSCQDCHMPAVADVAGCSARNGSDTHPTGGRRHELVGANLGMLTRLRDLVGDAGTGEVPSAFFDLAIARAEALLQTAATLELVVPEVIDVAGGVSGIEVIVTNETGHKLPSGYSEGRVMWLELTIDVGGTRVWSSGLWDGNEIADDPQVRRYEGIAERWSDGTRNHLLLNDHWRLDTRIPPRGLRPDPETDPVGERYTLGPDGTWPHADRVNYAFAGDPTVTAPDGSAEATVRARLLYVINTDEYIATLDADNVTNDAGARVRALYPPGSNPPVVLAEQVVTRPAIVTPGAATTAATGSSGDASSSAAATGAASSGETGSADASSGGASSDDTSATAASAGASDGDDAGGCACRTHPARGAPLGLLFGVAAVGLGLRRRRLTRPA